MEIVKINGIWNQEKYHQIFTIWKDSDWQQLNLQHYRHTARVVKAHLGRKSTQ